MAWVEHYEAAVGWVQRQAPGPDKFVHTYVGLAIWLGVAIVTRRGMRSPVPLLAVAALEAANETVDRVAHGSWMWHDTLGDAAATLFWPLAITLLLRRRNSLRA